MRLWSVFNKYQISALYLIMLIVLICFSLDMILVYFILPLKGFLKTSLAYRTHHTSFISSLVAMSAAERHLIGMFQLVYLDWLY
ncbi:hypothetical protein VU14_07325 [Aeromonas hydrophila]|nr:hypothetical protein VU14_07325 [Aeromonas hydrophila]